MVPRQPRRIALVKVTEGRFSSETKGAKQQSYLSREDTPGDLAPTFVSIQLERAEPGDCGQ
jgi:hypothetical protein